MKTIYSWVDAKNFNSQESSWSCESYEYWSDKEPVGNNAHPDSGVVVLSGHKGTCKRTTGEVVSYTDFYNLYAGKRKKSLVDMGAAKNLDAAFAHAFL